MKAREKEFCRLMTVYADPLRAAAEAGYREPKKELPRLLAQDEIADELQRMMKNLRRMYESIALCGLYRLACGDISDALALLQIDTLSCEKLRGLDLTCVSEIKKTDKGTEIKFCDRVKAIEKLSELLNVRSEGGAPGGLLEAITLSAQALRERGGVNGDGV